MSYKTYKEVLIYAQAGSLYLGTLDTSFTHVDASALTPNTSYTDGYIPSICPAGGYFWIADGQIALRRVAAATGVITQPAATAGALPTGARLLWLYRDRLFHGRFVADPYNYYASKAGDFLDYDASNRTPVGAFAGNDTPQAGLLGDVLTAAIPFGDVSCVMGMANSLALMRGDPKAGGAIDTLSREVGIVRQSAWARDPEQNLYFMARDGLYMLNGQALRSGQSASLKPMSRGRLDQLLGRIDHNAYKTLLSWDPQEQGLKIYLVPTSSTAATSAIFWDQRKDAFWPDQYPVGVGPTACLHVNGASGGRATALLGCWDGYLRSVDNAALDDDGSAIASTVEFTPQQFMGAMINTKIVGQRNQWGVPTDPTTVNATYQWRLGNDASSARVATAQPGGTVILGGYQSLDRTRLRGACGILQISNSVSGKTWSIEKVTILTAPSGRVRT